jgi:FAD/FMN-containing dehydrogenase
MGVQLQTHSGKTRDVTETAVAALRSALRGQVCVPGEPGYDAARSIWNAMIDRRPRVIVQALGAKVNRIAGDATAFGRRNVEFIVNVHTRWRDPAQDGACIAWARNLFDALAPHATGNVYVNFMSGDDGDRVRGAYGANYERLAAIKRRYDPENVFRLNQNIAA